MAGWLHRVANNIARRAMRAVLVRRHHETEAAKINEPAARDEQLQHELKELLDHELDHLAEKYRLPIILFHLEGQSLEEIAHVLGLKGSTLRTRLSRGREKLRARLIRRGITIGVAGLAAALSAGASSAGVTTTFVSSTTQAATLFAAGKFAAGGVMSAKTASLAKGAIYTMTVTKLKTVAAVIVAATLVTGGGVAVVHHAASAGQQNTREQLTPQTFAKLQTLIKPQPGEALWREISWHISIHEAHEQAAAQGKPLLVWSGGGAAPLSGC